MTGSASVIGVFWIRSCTFAFFPLQILDILTESLVASLMSICGQFQIIQHVQKVQAG